jgi:hypothetical protein
VFIDNEKGYLFAISIFKNNVVNQIKIVVIHTYKLAIDGQIQVRYIFNYIERNNFSWGSKGNVLGV